MAPTARAGAAAASTGARVWAYLALLTLQYGAQPLVSKRFVRRDVIVTSSVLACEVAKVICALVLLAKEGSLKRLYNQWTLVGSLTASGLPAAIYAIQNSLLQISYKNLDSLTFSILNQTKIFFTALFTYFILGNVANNFSTGYRKTLFKGNGLCERSYSHPMHEAPTIAGSEKDPIQKQSAKQIGALALLIFAAILLSIGEGSGKGSGGADTDQILFHGIIPVLVASVLSGLASALCQWATQVKKQTSYLMTVEMSIVGSLCLLASTYKSPDGDAIRKYGFFHGWTAWTLIPVITNALGGILVGLVTAHAGGVRKGFVIVSALLVTAILQFVFDGKPPSIYCLIALPLVIISISLYQKYPYKERKKVD